MTALGYKDRDVTQFVATSTDAVSGYPESLKSSLIPTGSVTRARFATGIALAALSALLIFSGNMLMSLAFFAVSVIGNLEYRDIISRININSNMELGMLCSLVLFISAALSPSIHDHILPVLVTATTAYFLTFKNALTPINEIAATMLGILYVGYLPSYWVRVRRMGEIDPEYYPAFLKTLGLDKEGVLTNGAIVLAWTWASIALADTAAYLVGGTFGKRKLSLYSASMGSASPNKTLEGLLGGVTACTAFSLLGAYVMRWPYWKLSGSSYGIVLSLVAFIGDLSISLLKRDAGVKDSGAIFPGHGGVLDRLDSYFLTGPLVFLFWREFLPLFESVRKKEPIKFIF
eukprot:CAMPEP_0185040942 /NCGR_PEP_ID=MMETSP1103-20130426/39642_1 /TAXON_ID=36769 /ORGANISM="Paraphysomonas bandaiensis, Strain Caron Lab Isolate" /LENGTH=345 /DNA_ID=CAMNT_0027580469 /DNA_START=167 /DNA_END=1204 /DNA_ORIENTATION=+